VGKRREERNLKAKVERGREEKHHFAKKKSGANS